MQDLVWVLPSMSSHPNTGDRTPLQIIAVQHGKDERDVLATTDTQKTDSQADLGAQGDFPGDLASGASYRMGNSQPGGKLQLHFARLEHILLLMKPRFMKPLKHAVSKNTHVPDIKHTLHPRQIIYVSLFSGPMGRKIDKLKAMQFHGQEENITFLMQHSAQLEHL